MDLEPRMSAVAYRAVLLAAGLLALGLLFEQMITLLLGVLITVIIAIGLASVADRLERGNVTIPLVMARVVKLHPAVIAVGVVLVGRLFGFVGLIVAVPILSGIVILVEELWVKPTEAADRAVGPSTTTA